MSVEHERGQGIRRDLVVVGASAGGVDALQTLVAGLAPEFPAAVLVVVHVSSSAPSVLPQILARRGALPAKFAEDNEVLQRGQIYVAPADHHLLVSGTRARVTRGPRENGHRPAIDPLFRSAARAAGRRAIGVVLSGMLDDGAAGLRFLKDHGGAAVVQAPADAQFTGMPAAAIRVAFPDRVVPLAEMGQVLSELVEGAPASDVSAEPQSPRPDEKDAGGMDLVEVPDPTATAALVDGPPSALTCPECGGALWEHEHGELTRYTCHVGHAFSPESLAEEQGRALEVALWSALRLLEERADMQRRLGRRAAGERRSRHEDRAEEAERNATTLRQLLGRVGRLGVADGEDVA